MEIPAESRPLPCTPLCSYNRDVEYFFSFDKLPYLRGEKPAGCILCLINQKSPEVVNLSVYENDLFNVSVNLYPYNPGHLLIFPKRHIEDIREYSIEEEAGLNRIVRAFLEVLAKTHVPQGYNIGYNMGLVAGASIGHLHLHVIPRYPRETGIADLIAGRRVLVEPPSETAARIRAIVLDQPPSLLMS